MIKADILVNPLTKRIYGIELKGHAGSAPYGQDLVCAAVSAIITGGANAIQEESETEFEINLESGDAKIIQKNSGSVTARDELILKVIVVQLETIAESYSQFIEIKKIIKEKD